LYYWFRESGVVEGESQAFSPDSLVRAFHVKSCAICIT